MHVVNRISPYVSSSDAISKFPETVSALGVKLDEQGKLHLIAPWGIHDLIMMKIRPTTFFSESKERMNIYERRIEMKKWHERWPLVEKIEFK